MIYSCRLVWLFEENIQNPQTIFANGQLIYVCIKFARASSIVLPLLAISNSGHKET